MKNIPLTKIGFFNPGRLSDEEIEQSFITRIPFFELLFQKIISEKPNSIPQQYLIIGQRGMGKTSLLVRIAAELRKEPYRKSFIPLSFPEEQYNVDRLSKFWLNCLDALGDALEKENKTTELPKLDADISKLSKENNLEANAVFETFKKWANKTKRRPVLLVDNLNLIFSKINREEQHQLRAILMSNGAPILAGASAASIEETLDYGAPFYDAFQISHLKKLSFQESLNVLLNLAKITGNLNFENSVYAHKGRLQALYQLTGGTPRTLALLFPLIQDGFSVSIQTDMDALLDVVTPLYKARFEELAPQLQVVMDAVALHWDPINLEQLRNATKLENAQLSPQLKRLVDVGWLQKLDAYKAKGGAYELSERFFNIWYLMRRSNRRQKRELYCLTKFLESFYGNDLDKIAQSRMSDKNVNINHITLDLALADAVRGEIGKKLRSKSYSELMDMGFEDSNLLKEFTIPSDVKESKALELFNEGVDFTEGKKYREAEESYKKALKLDKTFSYSWHNLGMLYYQHFEKKKEAEECFKRAIQIDEELSYSWNGLGNLYQDHFADYNKAEKAYKKAIEVDEKYSDPWNGLGNLYQSHFEKYIESEKAYKKAILIDDNFSHPWNGLGNLYSNHLEKYTEAEVAYKNAIKINEKLLFPWNGLGNLYLDHLRKYNEAEKCYKKAIELDSLDLFPKYNLLFLWRDKMSKIKESKELFNSIEVSEGFEDSYFLNKALFSFYDNNIGVAEEVFQNALSTIGEKIPNNTKDDWYRSASVIIKLGFGQNLLNILSKNDYHIILRPFYVAIDALTKKEDELFFNSISAEVREPAKKIVEMMKNYMK